MTDVRAQVKRVEGRRRRLWGGLAGMGWGVVQGKMWSLYGGCDGFAAANAKAQGMAGHCAGNIWHNVGA
jgi:hypothetical protein